MSMVTWPWYGRQGHEYGHMALVWQALSKHTKKTQCLPRPRSHCNKPIISSLPALHALWCLAPSLDHNISLFFAPLSVSHSRSLKHSRLKYN